MCVQEEITVAVQYYKALTSTCSAVLDRELPVDITTRPLHVAFFACLGQCMACLAALAERYNPQPGDTPRSSSRQGLAAVAEGDGGSCEPGRSSPTGAAGRRGGTTGRGVRNALLLDSDDEDEEGGAGQGGAAGAGGTRSSLQGGRGGVGVGGVPGVSDDVRLLLTASNLSYIRSRLMGSLTQRFLLVLTGEQGAGCEAREQLADDLITKDVRSGALDCILAQVVLACLFEPYHALNPGPCLCLAI